MMSLSCLEFNVDSDLAKTTKRGRVELMMN